MRSPLAVSLMAILSLSCSKGSQSTVQSTDSFDSIEVMMPDADSKDGVQLQGPESLKVEVHSFSKKGDEGFSVEINRSKFLGCFQRTGYTVTQLKGMNSYLVEINALMVPAVVCHPSMQVELESGVAIKIPASNGLNANYAKIKILNRAFKNQQNNVLALGKAIEQAPMTTETWDRYSYSSENKRAFSLEIDRRTIRSCYAGINYSTSAQGPRTHVVEATLMPVRAFCPENLFREIELGTSVKIPESKHNFQFGSLLVNRIYQHDKPLFVSIKQAKKATKTLVCSIYQGESRIQDMRINLNYGSGQTPPTATIESRFDSASPWNLDYSQDQSTLLVEGPKAEKIMLEGLTSYPNYQQTLDWTTDPRLAKRCWSTLPNFDLELSLEQGTDTYLGEGKYFLSLITDPSVECSVPEFSPAPINHEPAFIKCGAEN